MFQNPQVILLSDGIERMVEFYKRLGFAETFRVPTQGEPIHVDLTLDGYRIGIASGDSARDDHGLEPITTGQRVAVTLWTTDTRAAYDRLTTQGVRGLEPPHRWLDRLLIAWVEDPDGNPVQVAQHL